ncbi:MAG TPA: hypothetical protein VMZ30_21870, partial [Pyrinomonadaceae bacterium]|nr:hypothetical protein [Pyrinomonadaceae bacterium]
MFEALKARNMSPLQGKESFRGCDPRASLRFALGYYMSCLQREDPPVDAGGTEKKEQSAVASACLPFC